MKASCLASAACKINIKKVIGFKIKYFNFKTPKMQIDLIRFFDKLRLVNLNNSCLK